MATQNNENTTDTEQTATEEKGTPTFQTQVDEVVGKMTQDDNGEWQFPKDLEVDDSVMYAAKLEKRHRDTKSAYTKSRQKLKELETVNEKLTNHLVENATMHLSEEQREELDELKLRDPDKWREKLNEHESEAQRLLTEKLEKYNKEGKEMSQLEIRKAKMEAFSESTGIKLDDDVVENELPAKLSKDLANGTIDFDQFLEKAHTFLTSKKVVKGANEEPEPNRPDLSKVRGGHEPSDRAQVGDLVQSYEKEIY